MNILVCLKQVPGSTKVDIDETTGVLKRDGVDSKMNPYDLYALEYALSLKQEGDTITAFSMGPNQAIDMLKEAFGMGVDEAVLLSDRALAGADVLATSYAISQGIALLGDFDLILCGKQTTDGDTAQVGPELAQWLSLPHGANVIKIEEITDSDVTITLTTELGSQTQKLPRPCLLTIEKDANTPRLPSYKKLQATKDKEIRILGVKDLKDKDPKHYGLNGSPTQVERIFPPSVNTDKILHQGTPQELTKAFVNALKEARFL
ncbi:MAG: electron transfer flavoprotein subunit beta/FixA family protein [Erysipelotrichaceae bacterium]|jgi:electron transfer flavoprotein beta subunit|nr:electron transfer flavoprotein subunit beta/FixA family protein [Erysipelotrichaceae bacterium]